MRKLKQQTRIILIAVLLAALSSCGGGGGDQSPSALTSWVARWNRIAIDATGLDHTFPNPDQFGPTRASRAMAIIHIAMYDAVESIGKTYRTYTDSADVTEPVSMKAAVSEAAAETLSALFPKQAAAFEAQLQEDLDSLPQDELLTRGIALGNQVATAILALRSNDGSELDSPDKYTFKNDPGKWRRDPLNPDQQPLGPLWSRVKPFVLQSAAQFRVPPPPALTSVEYAEAYAEVQRIGGDGVITPTERTEDQTETGIYWAYDGTPSLCAPPRMYNQIAVQLAMEHGLDVEEFARFLALINTALADAGISIWESKYYYEFWRPVTGIRESDPGTGPTGRGDGNPLTFGDPNFTPLGSPSSNTNQPNFTPPFPTYPSGHAGFGGALFQMMRNYFGTDDIPFTFVSDEYNGVTQDSGGNTRPLLPRSFDSLSQAEEENGQSRVYLGIHWRFDKTSAIAQGRTVANYVYANAFQPR